MPTIIVDQAAALVTLAEAKVHLDIATGDTSHDARITTLLGAATRRVEIDTQRSLLERDLKLVLDCFPCERYIDLEFPPVSIVEAITYIDPEGDDIELDAALYTVSLETTQKARIRLKTGESWPETSEDPESVIIEYSAGKATAAEVEEDLKHAVLMLIAHLFENKMPVSSVQKFEVPKNYEWLIGPHRVW